MVPITDQTHSVGDVDDVPEPPAATGRYPDPVWNESEDQTTNATAQAAPATNNVPEPPGATGHYPGPVWAEGLADVKSADNPTAEIPMPDDTPKSVAPDSPASDSKGDAPTSPTPPDNLPLFLKDPGYADDFDDNIAEPESTELPVDSAELTLEAIYRIVREVAEADSGDAVYSAVRRDREFQTEGHLAFQQRQFGLAFGLVLFTQESGRLGQVLRLMEKRDAETFRRLFGEHAEDLLRITNAATAAERLQPVGGLPLWSPEWVARFRAAGSESVCQNAQNEAAIEGQFRKMLPMAARLGLTSDRGLGMFYDRVVTTGLGGALRQVVRTASPFRTAAQRQHALSTLGHATVAQFQASRPNLTQNGIFNARTHAALMSAVRRHGAIPLPTTEQIIVRLVDEARGTAKRRLTRLRHSTRLFDVNYRLTDNPV